MAGVAGYGNPACGHPVRPGFLFCPVCGQPAAGSVAPSEPSTAPLPVVPVIVAAALLAVVAGIVIFRPHAGSTAATGTTPSTSSQDARRQAAVRLSGLLAQSVTDRAAVIGAAEDVRGCGPSLRQDAQ